MKTELLLLTPLLMNPNNVVRPLNTPIYKDYSGNINLNVSKQYSKTTNGNLIETNSYMIPTEQNYKTGLINISQKSYINQTCLQINTGTQQQPQYTIDTWYQIIYIQHIEVIGNVCNEENTILTTYSRFPSVSNLFNNPYSENWTYDIYEEIDVNDLSPEENQRIQQIYNTYETDQETISQNATYIEDILTAQNGTSENQNATYGNVRNAFATLQNINTYQQNDSYYYGYIITGHYQIRNYPTAVDTTTVMKFTENPYQLGYQTAGYVEPTTDDAINLTEVILLLVGLPFTFVSQAFNFTLFAGTAYAINVSRIMMAILLGTIVLYIIKRFIL